MTLAESIFTSCSIDPTTHASVQPNRHAAARDAAPARTASIGEAETTDDCDISTGTIDGKEYEDSSVPEGCSRPACRGPGLTVAPDSSTALLDARSPSARSAAS